MARAWQVEVRQTAGCWRWRRGEDLGCCQRQVSIDLVRHRQYSSKIGFQPGWHALGKWKCGKQLAAGVGDEVKIWDAANGKYQLTLSGTANTALKLAFSPDGTRLASGSADGTVRVWDTVTGKEILTLYGNGGAVWRIAFSPDGNLLASASEDKTARVWDISPSGSRELLTIPGNNFW